MNPRREIARERRHQVQVRKAFETVLSEGSGAAGERTTFYLACADYLLFSMARLHEQDEGIHARLKRRIPVTDAGTHARLDELGERQRQSRRLMDAFRKAVKGFRTAGQAGLAAFEEHARGFMDRFTSLLAPRRNPFEQHTDELFTDEDWVLIAGVTDDSLAREEALFLAVRRSAPAGADPAELSVEKH